MTDSAERSIPLSSNPRALIEELVGYVTMTSDRIGFSRVLQKIEAQLARTPSRLDAEKVFGTMSMRARQRTSRENVGDVLAAMSEIFSGEPDSAPETAGDWLTNEQCDDVIAFLEDYEWTGLTRENVRTWCTAIAEARSSVKASGEPT